MQQAYRLLLYYSFNAQHMIVIADGGSTKTNWCLINGTGQQLSFDTEGYNPYYSDTAYIQQSLENSLPKDLPKAAITSLHYYGAGCSEPDKTAIVHAAMAAVFTEARVSVEHDLLAAARALLADGSGFVAILGTGCNTCLYDGARVSYNIDSLAYILGDEGSGCYLGKKLLGDYVRGYMPAAVRELFRERYQLTPDEVIQRIYTQPLPNRFCAGFSRFIHDNDVDVAYSQRLVHHAFTDFFENIVCHYPDYRHYSFNCIGSVGYFFKDILEHTALSYGMAIGRILRSPIPDLVQFHQAAHRL